MSDVWKRVQASPYFDPLVREPVGRTAEGLGQAVDLGNLGLGILASTQQGQPSLTPLSTNPVGGSAWMRQQFGLQPQEQLPSAAQRGLATTYNVLGPIAAGAVGGRVAQAAAGLGERGAVGPVPPVPAPASGEAGPIWRNPVMDALDEWKQGKGTPEQLEAHLRQYRGTKAQADWAGLSDWMKGKPSVTRDEVKAFIQEHPLQVEERILGGEADLMRDAATEYGAGVSPGVRANATRWGNRPNLQTPGGTDYRELLIKMPERDPGTIEMPPDPAHPGQTIAGRFPPNGGPWTISGNRVSDADGNYRTFPTEAEARRAHTALVQRHRASLDTAFRQQHFPDDLNVVSWSRFNERVDTEGAKTLHVEEVQSDWHRLGREGGYRTGEPDFRTWEVYVGNNTESWGRVNAANEQGALRLAREAADYNDVRVVDTGRPAPDQRVPNAPFKTSWPLMTMKRMIRYAVDHDMDQVTWTTGEMQAERYDLQKYVERIGYRKQGAGYQLEIQQKDGPTQEMSYTAEELPNVVGKEIAKRIIDGGEEGSLHGLELKMGGEWAKRLYDQELPNEVNKFVKRWGGKVDTTEIPAPPTKAVWPEREEYWEGGVPMKTRTKTVHRLKITPALRQAAKRGMELSQAAPTSMTG